MGQPLSTAWVVFLKHLSEVVGLLGARRVVGERPVSLLHLVIVHLCVGGDRRSSVKIGYLCQLINK